ncbi:MAG: glutaminyl-peptide cyclotransferase, partial [Boseongicola sp. SB0670_bin_30]|nr:glutaminyl-peptide cyclotransferase [Boseongicola sp. SB0670_bin_30]
NVWNTTRIAVIEPPSGQVRGWLDLEDILPAPFRTETVGVLNGIAYDAEEDRLFVTGKRWPRLFEIELIPPIDELAD